MKKISFFKSLFFIGALAIASSCGNNDEPEPIVPPTPDECAAATFPENTATVSINIKNFTATEGDRVVLNAAAGDLVTFAVEVQKQNSGDRPQKIRAYQTDCENMLGNAVTFPAGQSTLEQNNTQFDLRNTYDPQIKNIIYEVPSGISPLYLNFEVQESGGNVTYKKVKINVSGSGVIDSYSNITLAAQGNFTDPSRLATSTGQGYLSCDAASNISSVDVTYIVNGGDAYLTSNPARFRAPFSVTSGDITCDGETLNVEGGPDTEFVVSPKTIDFSTASDAQLSGIDFTGAPNYIPITNGTVYAFRSNGRTGLIKVNSGAASGATIPTNGTITVDVRAQR